MFRRFLAAYEPVAGEQPSSDPRLKLRGEAIRGFDEMMTAYPGRSFGSGIYRLHSERSGQQSDELVWERFPRQPRKYCFGYDWLGRQYALDVTERVGEEPSVTLIDLIEGEIYVLDATFLDFHDKLLVEDAYSALEAEMFAHWAKLNPDALPLKRHQIVGYVIPLSLGGEHELDNLVVTDIEIETELNRQISEQIRDLPDGTTVVSAALDSDRRDDG